MPTLDTPRAPHDRLIVPEDLLDAVREAVDSFALLPSRDDPVVVALSGGKDSIVLTMVLRELGRTVVPVTIDMGYETGWARRLVDLLAPLGITPHVVDARSLAPSPAGSALLPIAGIGDRFAVLDGMGTRPSERTPCTYCYGVKALALDHAARQVGAGAVALAHHLTDAQASLTKEALMHIDRHDDGHARFDRGRFLGLVERLRREMEDGNDAATPLLDRIVDLAARGRVDTDEPPRQPLLADSGGIDLVRPLIDVDESRIRHHVTTAGIRTLGSGCGHGATQDTATPRELVHHQAMAGMGSSAHERLRRAVRESVLPDGSGRVRARLRRPELLGAGYKPVERSLDKL